MDERKAQWLAIVVLGAVAIIAIVSAINASSAANAGQRTGWCYLESLVIKNPKSTPQKIHQTEKVVRNLLARIGEPDCSR